MAGVVRKYYQLTKPGIIYGNLMTAIAGFLLGSKWHINWTIFFGLIVGIALIIACGCVLNNYIDRDIDAKMARTKKRALVTGEIPVKNAFIYAFLLGLIGFGVLAAYTNWVTVVIGLIGIFDYVVLYTITKRKGTYGTIVGSVSGAMPLTAGYTAVSGSFNREALILFLIMTFWQMPHFYAIATYRLKDYKEAGIPVLPAVKGIKTTKNRMLLYIIGFIVASASLTLFGYTGYLYLIVMLAVGLWWLKLGIKGFKAKDDAKWARKLFGFSLIVLMTLSVAVSFGAILP